MTSRDFPFRKGSHSERNQKKKFYGKTDEKQQLYLIKTSAASSFLRQC